MITKDKANKKNILAIEDDIAVAKMLELLLVDYSLTILDSAEIALGYLKENSGAIDLILLDNMLPGMSGLELLAIIKKDDALLKIPVIMQSGDPSIFDRKSSAILADQILLKPYTKEKLVEAIAKIINQS